MKAVLASEACIRLLNFSYKCSNIDFAYSKTVENDEQYLYLKHLFSENHQKEEMLIIEDLWFQYA